MTKLFTTKEPALPMLLLILGCAGAVHAGFPGLATFAALIALALMWSTVIDKLEEIRQAINNRH
jgi:hypothetical protein